MIGIIDYKLGNVRAFANIYKELGIAHLIADNVEAVKATDRLILPGVGAFDTAMRYLDASKLRPAIEQKVLAEGCPLLGVCVGMQMLFEHSEEGHVPGLGWLRGTVRDLDAIEPTGDAWAPRPHMGWNTVSTVAQSPLMNGLGASSEFYFLHSYYCVPANASEVIAVCDYRAPFACVVGSGSIFGVQCHPEKSHAAGMRLLRNFAGL